MYIARFSLPMLICVMLAGSAGAYFEGLDELPSHDLYTNRQPYIFYHNVGLLELMVTNIGVIGNPFGWIDSNGAGWKGGEYLYAAALWFGAIASDNLPYCSTGMAYTGVAEMEFAPSLDPIDTIYPTYEGAPGGDRLGFSTSGGDDDQDGMIDEDPLNGKDDDGDGRIDEDFAAISQQMFTCEYWDYTPEARAAYPTHRPLYIKVRQNSYAWSTEGANEFIGLDYEIVNDGFDVLRDIYIGYFVDSDAGNPEAPDYYKDDGGHLETIDTTFVDPTIQYSCGTETDRRDCSLQPLHIDVALMHDTPGSEPGGIASDDLAAGVNGYLGGMFLGHTTDPLGERAPARVGIHTCHYFAGRGVYPDGDPRNDFERYDLLARGTRPRPTSQPGDYRYAFSAGPFSELLPGERLEFQMAFVIGHELDGLIDNAIMAQRVFNGQWRDGEDNPATGCGGRETCLHIARGGEPIFWSNPCDSLLPARLIKTYECNSNGIDNWVDADCNCCTPLQRGELDCPGWETLIHWVGTVAPPPPNLNSEDGLLRVHMAGDRRIKLEWNNTSELVPDPISGEIRFCGYRVWRVEGWERPLGSTGPRPSDWQLMADICRDPRGTQHHLDEFTNEFANIVDEVPNPAGDGTMLPLYEVGRYVYEDTQGLKNGMLYFYDVTAYSCWTDSSGNYLELSSQPAALEREGIRPTHAAVSMESWKDLVHTVPNPWRGGAAWDLRPSNNDPTGTHLDFVGLPEEECTIRIYTLAGDLVQTLRHDGRTGAGTTHWNMITRNGQGIISGVYLYAATCADETAVGRFTVIR